MSTILLVEDTAIIRQSLARLLQCEGFDVVCAGDGLEALRVLKSRPVDLVLMDVMMPKMDGIALLEALRSNDHQRVLPVIAMTGVLDTAKLKRLRDLGVKSIIAKGSYSFESMMSEIRAHVVESHHPQSVSWGRD